jgi:hypothetical protein
MFTIGVDEPVAQRPTDDSSSEAEEEEVETPAPVRKKFEEKTQLIILKLSVVLLLC